MTDANLIELFPKKAKKLLSSNGRELISQIGIDIIKGIIYDVLTGKNIRDSTELLTRKRIATLNAATIVSLLKGEQLDSTFIEKLPDMAAKKLSQHMPKADKWILQWVLGLTDKAFQNVLRDDVAGIDLFKQKYTSICEEVIAQCSKEYGNVSGQLSLDSKEKVEINWTFLLQLMTMVGAQTLAIRGSEKSTYGKLFERLVLGSLLHILGFKLIKPDIQSVNQYKKVFWLTSPKEKRESDATVLLDTGKGVRFDIGFIGRGNPEISLDKVTRFERELEMGPTKWYMATIIIVDRIGKSSKIESLAKRVGGTIIQMSASYWPEQVADILKKETGFKAELLSIPHSQFDSYLNKHLSMVPFDEILNVALPSP